MAGLYIHIPFCSSKCHYCNFYSSTSTDIRERVIESIVHELILRVDYIKEPVETIYFGGGSPSILDLHHLYIILDEIYRHFYVIPEVEITIEANPEHITTTKVSTWKKFGINRISLGVQSFNDRLLVFINRKHNRTCILNAIDIIQKHYTNYNIDLIIAIPTQSERELNEDIKLALEIAPPHISTYIMTIDGKSFFNVLKQDNKLKELDDEFIARYFLCVHDQLTQYGYEHYEISNFAKNDMFAKHNSNYWRNTIPYLGIGPSASSYNIFSRQTNIANNQVYVDNIQRNIIPMTIEYLTAEQQLNEYIINNLRTSTGLDIIELYNNFKYKIAPQYIELLSTNNLVQQQGGKIKLTPRGMLISNQIIINLIKDY